PGRDAIEEMFRRRAYNPKLAWVRRIQQADDTDLGQLVKLEETYGIKFHFFLSANSKESVPASTAVGLKERGGKIYHDLLVYHADTQFEKASLEFLRNLHALGLYPLRREMDLSRVSEEQMSFLARLSDELLKNKRIPYPHEKGDRSLREKLAKFLSFYCYYNACPENLFVGPERPRLLAMILKMVAAEGGSVLLSSSLEALYASVCRQQGLKVILGNNDLSELLQLDEVFSPRISVISPYQLRDPSPLILESLIDQARQNPDRCYLVDDSEDFEIGSELQSNMMLRLLGQKDLPDNLIFIYGLIKNTVCPDFELSFLINAPAEWISPMEICAELSYSRISYIIQLYYEWLFDELLSFPFVEDGTGFSPKQSASRIRLSPKFMQIAEDPVFAAKPISLSNNELIRLDYGEFEHPVPNLLVKGLLKGFLESPSDSLVFTLQERVAAYVSKTRHANIDPANVVLGQGVFPLFAALVQSLKERLGRAPLVAVASGSYGPIFPLLSYYGAQTILLETSPAKAFLPTDQDISALKETPDLLYICQPGNPSGIFIESEMIRRISKICAERGIYIFADEIFFLLSDSNLGSWTPAELSFAYPSRSNEKGRLFFADGLAKSFAAGGLRAGFIVCPDRDWAQSLREFCAPVPQAILRSWDRLYSVFMEESPHQLIDTRSEFDEMGSYLRDARAQLTQQREKLLKLLNKHSLADGLRYARRGGLFVLARMAAQTEKLAREKQILLNTGDWSRSGDWARICFSLPPEKFDEAFERLSAFLS
ncbi:MAG: aminotransferase class I/II-fold pyridoxal phosphate-dependent enzyme, partial [Candidatus Obscuribacterales bacterium]|nr:aminotransferase class I/II-fold pyridoxal phosphate-dependent enzyme [Candidatus Obscuribacterales bacterium]